MEKKEKKKHLKWNEFFLKQQKAILEILLNDDDTNQHFLQHQHTHTSIIYIQDFFS